MAQLTETAYGWLTPTLAYLFSFLGCLLGLKATARARMLRPGASRVRWLVIAAWAIGGTGIWVMHFIAMIGFAVNGTPPRFDLSLTIASWLIAVVVVGFGLFVVGYGKPSLIKIVIAGFFMGIGVAGMHYTGMSAMKIDGMEHYDTGYVVASVVIAVVASTVALWFTVVVKRSVAVLGAGAIMAIAVCGMHYTGMLALTVQANPIPAAVAGAQALSFLVPIFIFVLLVVIVLGYGMLNTMSEADATAMRELEERLSSAASTPVAGGGRGSFRVDQRRF